MSKCDIKKTQPNAQPIEQPVPIKHLLVEYRQTATARNQKNITEFLHQSLWDMASRY